MQLETPARRSSPRVGWPSGPRRQFKALVSSEAWVRIPLQSHIPVSLVGQDTRLSPARPGFKSRTGNFFCRSAKIGPKSLMGAALEFRACVPPELRWQSGRLLTARSSVRSRVEAHLLLHTLYFLSFLASGPAVCRSHGADARCTPGVAQR